MSNGNKPAYSIAYSQGNKRMTEKRPIDLVTAAAYLGSVLVSFVLLGGLIWVTGLYDWLAVSVTKDAVGLIAAILMVLITLAVISTNRSSR